MASKMNVPDLSKYDGTSDPTRWMKRFCNLCKIKGVKDEQLVMYLEQYMKEGSSAEMWFEQRTEDDKANWNDLVTKFEERFSQNDDEYANFNRLKCRNMQTGESVDSYIEAMQRLGAKLNFTTEQTIPAVIVGMPPSIQQHLRKEKLKSIDDLVKQARLAASVQQTQLSDLQSDNGRYNPGTVAAMHSPRRR